MIFVSRKTLSVSINIFWWIFFHSHVSLYELMGLSKKTKRTPCAKSMPPIWNKWCLNQYFHFCFIIISLTLRSVHAMLERPYRCLKEGNWIQVYQIKSPRSRNRQWPISRNRKFKHDIFQKTGFPIHMYISIDRFWNNRLEWHEKAIYNNFGHSH